MLKRASLLLVAALALTLSATSAASAHSISLTKADKKATEWTLDTAVEMDRSYGGGETYDASGCKGKKKNGHRHKVVCDYQVVGRNDEIGKWACVGEVKVLFKRKRSKKLKAEFGSMEHLENLPESR